MKRTLLISALALMAGSALAQQAIIQPKVTDNWSIGIDGGAATPLVNHPFFGSMRGTFGAKISKQLTPIVGLGAEGQAYVNTSSWTGVKSKNAIDESYVGVYGTIDLMNLFGGYQCGLRPFTIDAVAGVGWGHHFWPKSQGRDNNFAASKAGLNFNYNASDNVTFTLQPAIMWNMTQEGAGQSSAAYNAKRAAVNITAGVTYRFGGYKFDCVEPLDPMMIEAMNAQINALRGQVEDASAAAAAFAAQSADLADQLAAAQARPQVIEADVTEVNLNTMYYIFFKIDSSVIRNDQMPNVEMIAAYLKNNPDATVVINGYASKDGPEAYNVKLSQKRAEAVKDALVNKYGINPSRIQAQGDGIGQMFQKEAWNRVSICTVSE